MFHHQRQAIKEMIQHICEHEGLNSMDKFKSRLAKRWSILILTRPVVNTGYNLSLLVDWWSIEAVDWVNYSQAYKCIDMPL